MLLDEDIVAHVGDFGLVKFLFEASKNPSQAQTLSVGLKGSIGYIPPHNFSTNWSTPHFLCNNFVFFCFYFYYEKSVIFCSGNLPKSNYFGTMWSCFKVFPMWKRQANVVNRAENISRSVKHGGKVSDPKSLIWRKRHLHVRLQHLARNP